MIPFANSDCLFTEAVDLVIAHTENTSPNLLPIDERFGLSYCAVLDKLYGVRQFDSFKQAPRIRRTWSACHGSDL